MEFHRISLRPSPCRGREVPSLPGKHGKALTSTRKKHNEHLTVFRLQCLHLLGSDADIWLVLTGSRNHAQFSSANVIQIFVVQMIQMTQMFLLFFHVLPWKVPTWARAAQCWSSAAQWAPGWMAALLSNSAEVRNRSSQVFATLRKRVFVPLDCMYMLYHCIIIWKLHQYHSISAKMFHSECWNMFAHFDVTGSSRRNVWPMATPCQRVASRWPWRMAAWSTSLVCKTAKSIKKSSNSYNSKVVYGCLW